MTYSTPAELIKERLFLSMLALGWEFHNKHNCAPRTLFFWGFFHQIKCTFSEQE